MAKLTEGKLVCDRYGRNKEYVIRISDLISDSAIVEYEAFLNGCVEALRLHEVSRMTPRLKKMLPPEVLQAIEDFGFDAKK